MRESTIFLSKPKYIGKKWGWKRISDTAQVVSAILCFPLPCQVSLPCIAEEQERRWANFTCVFPNRYSCGCAGDQYSSTLWYFQVPDIESFWISLSGANSEEDEGISLLPCYNIVQSLLSLEDASGLLFLVPHKLKEEGCSSVSHYLNFTR